MFGETVEFDVRVVACSDRAILCEIDGEEYWIPMSQIASGSEIDESSERDDEGVLVMSKWIAKQKGLL